ncbi:hypothetical protein BGZ73_005719 [Actinomortierella ambigua]|nr:hypothetical protein BGZ73_005719 [Actinomortierella ambigua]
MKFAATLFLAAVSILAFSAGSAHAQQDLYDKCVHDCRPVQSKAFGDCILPYKNNPNHPTLVACIKKELEIYNRC